MTIEFAALAGFFDQPGTNRDGQRRTQSDPHHQSQRDPTLAVQKSCSQGRLAEPPRKGGPVGLVAVIVFDADPRPLLRATGNQRIVDDQVDQFVWVKNEYD